MLFALLFYCVCIQVSVSVAHIRIKSRILPFSSEQLSVEAAVPM